MCGGFAEGSEDSVAAVEEANGEGITRVGDPIETDLRKEFEKEAADCTNASARWIIETEDLMIPGTTIMATGPRILLTSLGATTRKGKTTIMAIGATMKIEEATTTKMVGVRAMRTATLRGHLTIEKAIPRGRYTEQHVIPFPQSRTVTHETDQATHRTVTHETDKATHRLLRGTVELATTMTEDLIRI